MGTDTHRRSVERSRGAAAAWNGEGTYRHAQCLRQRHHGAASETAASLVTPCCAAGWKAVLASRPNRWRMDEEGKLEGLGCWGV